MDTNVLTIAILSFVSCTTEHNSPLRQQTQAHFLQLIFHRRDTPAKINETSLHLPINKYMTPCLEFKTIPTRHGMWIASRAKSIEKNVHNTHTRTHATKKKCKKSIGDNNGGGWRPVISETPPTFHQIEIHQTVDGYKYSRVVAHLLSQKNGTVRKRARDEESLESAGAHGGGV